MKNRIDKSKPRSRLIEKDVDNGPQKKHELTLSAPDGVAIAYTELDPDQVRDFLKFSKMRHMTPGDGLWEVIQSFNERRQHTLDKIREAKQQRARGKAVAA